MGRRRRIYLVGSLRNPAIPALANRLEDAGHEVFSDWHGAGAAADDSWRDYEKARGRTYLEALRGPAARNIFEFDKRWLEWADTVVVLGRPGLSAALELAWAARGGAEGYVLLDGEPERWDCMLQFATDVFLDEAALFAALEV